MRKDAHRSEDDVEEVTAAQACSLRIAYERKAHRDKLIAVNVRGISGTQSMSATIMTVARYAAIKAGYPLDSVAMGHKLRLPGDAWRAFCLGQFIHRGITDLPLDRFAVVHHRKCERQSIVVVSQNLATDQRHRNQSLWK